MKKITIKNKYSLLFTLIILTISIFFFLGVNSDFLLDDNRFIFGESGLIKAKSFFAFWQGDSGFTRSWPLSYALMWSILKAFGTKIVILKYVNILFHALNALLLYKILLSSKSIYLAFFVSLIFFIHPIQIESIYWAFQFKTIISITFALISHLFLIQYLDNSKVKSLFFASLFFYMSLASKITLIGYPIFLIWYFYNLKTKFSKSFHILSVLLLISLSMGLKTIEGVKYNKTEVAQQEIFESIKNIESTPNNDIEKIVHFEKNIIIQEIHLSSRLDTIVQKVDSIFFTSSFYLSNFLGFVENSYFYKKTYENSSEKLLYLSIGLTLVISLLIIGEWSGCVILFFTILFPVSGIYYVPYMKFSLVADHWAYALIAPLAIILYKYLNLIPYKNLKISVMALVLLLFGYKSFRYKSLFTNKVLLLDHTLSINDTEESLYLEKVSLNYKIKNNKEILSIISKVLENPRTRLKTDLLLELAKVSESLAMHELAEKCYSQIALNYFYNGMPDKMNNFLEKTRRLNEQNTNYKFLRIIENIENYKNTRDIKYINSALNSFN